MQSFLCCAVPQTAIKPGESHFGGSLWVAFRGSLWLPVSESVLSKQILLAIGVEGFQIVISSELLTGGVISFVVEGGAGNEDLEVADVQGEHGKH
jgi:hypothetical protein